MTVLPYDNNPFILSRCDGPGVPIDAARTNAFRAFMKTGTQASKAYPVIRGLPGNAWGTPFVKGVSGDPVWKLKAAAGYSPDSRAAFLGTTGFHASADLGDFITGTSDSPVGVFDSVGGFSVFCADAVLTATHEITCTAWQVTWHGTNGLDHSNPLSDGPNNTTSRGRLTDAMIIRRDFVDAAIAAGTGIGHVLHMFLSETKSTDGFCHPMTGAENNKVGWGAEGERIRIKPSVNLASKGLSAFGLAIARTLQEHGTYFGDNAGALSCVKAQQDGTTIHPWAGLTTSADALAGITWDDFEVIERGWQADVVSGGGASDPYKTALLLKTPTVFLELDETSGTSAADSSGNAHSGTYQPSLLTLGATSLLGSGAGKSVDFTAAPTGGSGATGGFVTIPYGSWMNSSYFGVSAVIKPDLKSSPYASMIAARDTADAFSSRNWSLFVTYDGYLTCFVRTANVSQQVFTHTTQMTAGTVYDVGLSYDGSQVRLSVDGNVQTFTAAWGPMGAISLPIRIGWDDSGVDSSKFDGRIDGFAYYTYGLSNADFSDLHTARIAGASGGGGTPGLVGAQVVQHKGATTNVGTSCTVTLDAPAQAGNLLIAIMSENGNSSNAVMPSGFTKLGGDSNTGGCNIDIARKTAVGGETSVTYTCNTANSRMALAVYEITGATGDPTLVSGQTPAAANLITLGPDSPHGLELAAASLGTDATSSVAGNWDSSMTTDEKLKTTAVNNNVQLVTGSVKQTAGQVTANLPWTGTAVQATGFLMNFASAAGSALKTPHAFISGSYVATTRYRYNGSSYDAMTGT